MLTTDYGEDRGNEIVISGFSGRLPESSNIEEFKQNLFDGIDMVNEKPSRWPRGLYNLSTRVGKFKDEDLENFDLQYFRVHQNQAECMDPQMRMLLEVTHEAIIDAGVNPRTIRGSRTGVYIGVSASMCEIENNLCKNINAISGYAHLGCSRSMFANRVSFSFDFRGPSYSVDTTCSSSLYAFAQAYADIKSGTCDAAIVGGVNLIFPKTSLQLQRLGVLSSDGKCKSFDESGSGYVRSDGCVSIFLQKATNAKRIYAHVLNVKTNTDGYKEEGITFPKERTQNALLRDTYESIGLNPADATYFETHGTGTIVGDPQEIGSITDFFLEGRTTPLLIGSVKSNMGHAEHASGACAIVKILLAMESGIIPGNLHFKKPNPLLHGIIDGRLKVVDKNTAWNGGIVSISNFGFGGSNAHAILKSNSKTKQVITNMNTSLVICSGRTEDAVYRMLNAAEKHKTDMEYLGMINEIHKTNIPMHYYRGYSVVGGNELIQNTIELVEESRPIWYIYSGIGSQWAGMGKDLMQIEIFKRSIDKSAEVLSSKGIDLIHILTESNENLFNIPLNTFVSIVAIQIALTDLLTHLDIKPDGVIGISVGELGCAYVDGCLTAEETILAAYYRGVCVLEADTLYGEMAAIGLSHEECLRKLPSNVFVACHISRHNSTISGPSKSVIKVVNKLTEEGIFARLVRAAGVPFHSKYISAAGILFKKSLEQLITKPKKRSSRWISSSVPENDWNSQLAKYSSASYHANNFLSPVLFEEASQHIPKNAICIEIGAHGIFQTVLKRSLGDGVTNLSLINRDHQNNVIFMLSNIGKLYGAGAQPNVTVLNPPISFPVSRGTPMINSNIGWDHSQKFLIPKIGFNFLSDETIFYVNISEEQYSFLLDHAANGKSLVAATTFIMFAWQALVNVNGLKLEETPVTIENILFHRAIFLPRSKTIKFEVHFLKSSGQFEIIESGAIVISGYIRIAKDIENERIPLEELKSDDCELLLNSCDVYKELCLRGCNFTGLFAGIVESDYKARTGKLKWNNNWITFMDTMIQFSILGRNLRELYMMDSIKKIIIDPIKHFNIVEEANDIIPISMYKELGILKSGGIEMHGLLPLLVPRRYRNQVDPILQNYTFYPHRKEETDEVFLQQIIVPVIIQLLIEHFSEFTVLQIGDVVEERTLENILTESIISAVECEPIITANITIITSKSIDLYQRIINNNNVNVVHPNNIKQTIDRNLHLIVGYNVLSHPNGSSELLKLKRCIQADGFILLKETQNTFDRYKANKYFLELNLVSVSEQSIGNNMYILLRTIVRLEDRNKQVVFVNENSYSWLNTLQVAMSKADEENKYVYVICQGSKSFGALGLINCLKKEVNGKYVRLVFIEDNDSEEFNFLSELYRNQLKKDLIINVLKQGMWGSYRHLILNSNHNSFLLPVEHAYVKALYKGDMSSLNWIEGPPYCSNINTTEDILCTVCYASINMRDLILTSGTLTAHDIPDELSVQDTVLGMEFAGRDNNGTRIMALVQSKALATKCVTNKKFIWNIPDNWTMAQASTIPRAYSEAYYALVVRGQLAKDQSILIHDGFDSVGEAAIAIALHYGVTIYITVRNHERMLYMKSKFPQLPEQNIHRACETLFKRFILMETNGEGVDVILNLLEENIEASVHCLKKGGRFLQKRNTDFNNTNNLTVPRLSKNSSFHDINVDDLMEGNNSNAIDEVVNLVADGIKNGVVRPLPATIFNSNEIKEAFNFMASQKYIGKVVVKIKDEDNLEQSDIKVLQRTYLHPEKTYIIVDGLTGISIELSYWMASIGAKNLVFVSRKGIENNYQLLMVRRLQDSGISVVFSSYKSISYLDAEDLLLESSKLGPIGGIFYLGADISERTFNNLTENDFQLHQSIIEELNNLHKASRNVCNNLDYFVCFSNITAGRGNKNHLPYGLTHSAIDRLCENRQAEGLPATSIHFGDIADTGLFTDNHGNSSNLESGTLPQSQYSFFKTMDLFLRQPHPILSSIVIADKQIKSKKTCSVSAIDNVLNILGVTNIKNVQPLSTLASFGIDLFMATEIKQILERDFNIIKDINDIWELTITELKAFDATLDKDNEHTKSEDCELLKCVANVLSLRNIHKIRDQLSLADLGMDSIMATEIQQILDRDYNITMTSKDIRHLTFAKLKILGATEGAVTEQI